MTARRMHHLLRSFAAAGLLALGQALPAHGQELAGEYSVAQVKAAFLYHFGTYVQWPESAASDAPLTIAVLGAPRVAIELARMLPGRTIQGRPVRVRRLRTLADLGDAEILYLGPEVNDRLAAHIGELRERPTLIVTDSPEGLEAGAMINFQLVEQRVRFEVAVRSAERAGLTLSSRLLGVALRVVT